jgi:hypothetical protein
MVKIVLRLLVLAFTATTSAASAERPDCNGFPDFRARMTCYELVSRAPPERVDQKPAVVGPTAAPARRDKHRGRRTAPMNWRH